MGWGTWTLQSWKNYAEKTEYIVHKPPVETVQQMRASKGP